MSRKNPNAGQKGTNLIEHFKLAWIWFRRVLFGCYSYVFLLLLFEHYTHIHSVINIVFYDTNRVRMIVLRYCFVLYSYLSFFMQIPHCCFFSDVNICLIDFFNLIRLYFLWTSCLFSFFVLLVSGMFVLNNLKVYFAIIL